MTNQCQCYDSGCTHDYPGKDVLNHRYYGGSCQCEAKARLAVFRVDMDDETGTRMCRECAEDALESGVFRTN